jgi:hypothetical protein
VFDGAFKSSLIRGKKLVPTSNEKAVIKLRIQKVLKDCKLTRNTQRATDILIRAIFIARDYRLRPYYHYLKKPKTRRAMSIGKPTGRKDQEALRFYVLFEAKRAWNELTTKKATMPARNALPTVFLRFLEGIFLAEGFSRFSDNWQEYKSYLDACEQGGDFFSWQELKRK